MSSPPFFIVGCGRSGTTLLRTLLNRHPEVAVPLESLFIVDYLRAARSHPVRELVEMLVQEPEIAEWGMEVEAGDLAGCSSIADAIRRLHVLYAEAHGKRRWGQKTPRFIRHMGLLTEHFPDARFVHLLRDPRAVTNSLISSDVHQSNAYYASKRWNTDVRQALAFEQANPGRVLTVTYEKLVTEPGRALRAICEHLNLSWPSDRWWEGEDEPTAAYSAFFDQIHRNLDNPVTANRISAWRRNLSPRQVRVVESVAGSTMSFVGYPLDQGGFPPSQWYLAYLHLERLSGLARQSIKYFRQRRAYFFHLFRRKQRLGLLSSFLRQANY